MEDRQKNILTFLIIIGITLLALIYLPLIPNFLREVQADDIVGLQPGFLIAFLLFDILLIGIFAGVHKIYSNDYSRINKLWFFALFGGVTGALLGEQGNFVMIIPYTILMLIYGYLYKKFTWWKVASTSYLGGIIVENVINRSPIQLPTLTWIAFFTYPYFATKIFENRKKIKFIQILKDFKWAALFSIILAALAAYFSRNNISPPLIFLGFTLPFIITVIYKTIKK